MTQMRNAARLLLIGAALFCFYPWHWDSRPAKIKAHLFERIGSLAKTGPRQETGTQGKTPRPGIERVLGAEPQKRFDGQGVKAAASEMAGEKNGPRLPLDEKITRIKEKISSAQRRIGL